MPLYGALWLLSLSAFILVIAAQSSNAYELVCPENIARTHRAKSKCNNTPNSYICLKNDVTNSYVEECDGPRTDREGRIYLHSGGYKRGECNFSRYQPYKFNTQGLSQCAFLKSLCSKEGQVSSSQTSFISNRLCYCDGDRGYDFVSKRDYKMACNDEYEDCSCYRRTSTTVLDGSGYNVYVSSEPDLTTSDTTKPNAGHIQDFSFSWDKVEVNSSKQTVIIVVGVSLILVSVIFLLFFINEEWIESFFHQKEVDDGGTKKNNSDLCFQHLEVDGIDEELHFSHLGVFKKEELYYLMLVHLVFGLGCAAVRVKFKQEINEKYFKKELEVQKNNLRRKVGNQLSQEAIHLLWPINRAKEVSTDKLDIRLMVLLLNVMTDLKILDRVPLDNDRTDSSLLARIKYVRNVVTLAVNGTMNYRDFKEHWKHTLQAAYQLLEPYLKSNLRDVSSIIPDQQLVGRVESHLKLNIFKKFEWFERMLQQIILEFCASKKITITKLLEEEKHTLCHKRKSQRCSCTCMCSDKVFFCEISDFCWNTLFYIDKEVTRQLHQCGNCVQVKANLDVMTFDVSVLKCLVLNVTSLSRYILTQLYENDLQCMLSQHQHLFFHAYKEARCCKCKNDSEKTYKCLTKSDFQFMFSKKICHNGVKCKAVCCSLTVCNNKDCCCKFIPKAGRKMDDIDNNLLHKIIRLVIPFGTMGETGTRKIHEFYTFMCHNESFERSVKNMLKVVKDRKIVHYLKAKEHVNGPAELVNSQENVSGPLEWMENRGSINKQQERTVPRLTALYENLYDEDTLLMRKIYSKAQAKRTSEVEAFIDLHKEENNFLLLFYVLQQVVCPVIRDEVEKQCKELQELRREIENGLKIENKPVYISHIHYERLRKDTSSNYDLKLMIILLEKVKTEARAKTNFYTHLENIKSVRHVIMTNSTGRISDKVFYESWKLLHKALHALNGDQHSQRLAVLKGITNIFEYTK